MDTEFRIVRADGEERWLAGKGRFIFDTKKYGDQLDPHDRAIRFLGLNYDITERKHAQEMVQDSEDRLHFALETIQTGAWDLNLLDHTAHRSLTHDRIFGYTELLPEWTYEMFLEHVLPEERAAVDTKFRKAMESKGDWNFECRIRRTDGEIRWILAAGRHRHDAKGGMPSRMVGVVQDITERKLAGDILKRDKDTLEKLVQERSLELLDAQMELERAKRLSDIGTLAATVAHELRNPLAAISMATAIIKRDPSKDMVERQLKNVEKMIWESNQIIDNLLSYSRLRSPRYEICELHAILMECLEIHKQQHTKKKILFKTHLDPEANMTMADPIQMREVFNNLLNNASDAVPAVEGQIEIQVHDVGDDIEIIIDDNGPGIDGKILDKVFAPFFSTKTKGTGLGLSVCKQIVNMHDGEIEMRSKPALGTSVIVRLPKKK